MSEQIIMHRLTGSFCKTLSEYFRQTGNTPNNYHRAQFTGFLFEPKDKFDLPS